MIMVITALGMEVPHTFEHSVNIDWDSSTDCVFTTVEPKN